MQPVNEYLVCYDIHNPRARRRACKFLRQLSPGYQKSGFEIWLPCQQEQLLPALEPFFADQDRLLLTRFSHHQPDWQLGTSNRIANRNLLIWN